MKAETQLPSSVDNERATLKCLTSDLDGMTYVTSKLKAEHFYVPKHRMIYEAMLTCHAKRVPTDVTNVHEELRKRGRSEEIGGMAGVDDVIDVMAFDHLLLYYVENVTEAAANRRFIQAGGRIAEMGYDETMPVQEKRAKARQMLDETETADATDTTSHTDVLIQHEETLRQRSQTTRYLTGVNGIDERVRLLPQRLITIAGPTGQGKSSLAECTAEKFARDGGQVLYWSAEMAHAQMMDRRLARMFGMNMKNLELGTLTDDEYRVYVTAQERIAAWPGAVHINDIPSSVHDICAAATKQKARTGLDLLIVDHLQLIQRTGKQSMYDMVTEACVRLKQLSMDLHIPIIQLSQLSREFYKSSDGRPQTWHMKESGEVENSSDTVIFVWFSKESEEQLRAMPGVVTHISMEIAANGAVAKNRFGTNGDFLLSYVGGRFAFKG